MPPHPSSPLAGPPVASIPEAILRLDEIQTYVEATAPRGRYDGVACFNWMYGIITIKVFEAVERGAFEEKEFLLALDLAFVNLYLDALRADATGDGEPPRSWQALLESRDHPRITAVQFALAGKNAHINFDLSSAVVAACARLGTEPEAGTHRADFNRVNDILGAEIAKVREHLQNRLEDWIDDHVLGQVDDILGKWSIEAARDTAWTNAELLWCIRDDSFATKLFLTSLDRLVGLAGRGLLVSF